MLSPVNCVAGNGSISPGGGCRCAAKVVLPKSITRQILQQARHDPAVLAPGAALALPALRQCSSIDVHERGGIDATGLAALPMRPKTVLVLSRLVAGEAEKYAADLLDALRTAGDGPMLVVLTEQSAADAGGLDEISCVLRRSRRHRSFSGRIFVSRAAPSVRCCSRASSICSARHASSSSTAAWDWRPWQCPDAGSHRIPIFFASIST